jgi:hypothetical protein
LQCRRDECDSIDGGMRGGTLEAAGAGAIKLGKQRNARG